MYCFVNLDSIMTQFNLPNSWNLPALFWSIIGGFVGVIWTGYYVKRMSGNNKFKKMLLFCNLFNMICFITFNISLLLKSYWVLMAELFILVFFNAPLMTLGTELACLLSHPIGEGLVAGILQIASALFGVIISMASSFFLES